MLAFMIARFGMSKLGAQLLLLAIAGAAVGAGLYAAYHAGVKHERAIWETKIEEYKAKLQKVEEDAKTKIKHLQDEQQKVVDELDELIKIEQAKHERVRTVIKEVKTYVTSKADAGCTVTDGAVRVLDMPLLS